jgi:hypothetical protein
MKPGADEAKWRWIDPEGKEHSGSKGILSAELARSLPVTTLVWRSGWAEWLPANKVAELAYALPAGSAEPPREPPKAVDPKLVPPKPDLTTSGGSGSFSTVVPAPRNAAKFVRPQISPPRITLPSEQKARAPEPAKEKPPSSFGVLGGKRPEMAPPPQSAPRPPSPSPFAPERGTMRYEGARAPMPTLADEAPPATATLRPPGAVPPPPRGAAKSPLLDPVVIERFAKIRAEDTPLPAGPAKTPSVTEEIEAEDVDMALDESLPTKRKDVPATKPPSELAPAIVNAPASAALPSSAAATPPPPPSGPPPAPSRAPPAPAAPPSGVLDATLSSSAPLPPEPAPAPAPAAPPARSLGPAPLPSPAPSPDSVPAGDVRRLTLWIYALVALAALMAMLAAFLVLNRSSRPSAAEAPPASVSAAPAAPQGCAILAHPARLGATVDRGAPPMLAARDVNGRLALGFAESPKKAVGLLVAPQSLDAEKIFEKASERPLKAVVPLIASGAPTFAVDSDGGPLKFARTVDAPLPFSVGLGEGAIARVVSSSPEPIWPSAATVMTEPRVASIDGGHAVTFRDGGLEGKIMLGWLAEDGTKRSELAAVAAPKLVGTPFVAATDGGFLLVFAGRETNQDPWRVEMVRGAAWKTETERVTFDAPPGGTGGGQIAPSAAPLPGGQWLLQWTEGKTGNYQVRVQRLGSKLEPLGDPLHVSPKGASSGQGSLFVVGKHALSLYIQTIGGHDELWATTLECR